MQPRTTAAGYRIYWCPVCGHVEWLPRGAALPRDYRCPLCGAGARTMLPLDDPRARRHRIAVEELAPRVFRARKEPPFHREYEHFSYLLAHPDGVVLFDAPPVLEDEGLARVLAIGRPRLLVVSHTDFVAVAGSWAEALGVPAWMGARDEPLPGNRFIPDRAVTGPVELAPDLEVVALPGHSPGSFGLYWSGAPGGPVLCCGDAVTVWRHHPGGRVQVALLQDRPLAPATRSVLERPLSLLLSCTGHLHDAGPVVASLLAHPEPFARPYRGETGGVWIEANRG